MCLCVCVCTGTQWEIPGKTKTKQVFLLCQFEWLSFTWSSLAHTLLFHMNCHNNLTIMQIPDPASRGLWYVSLFHWHFVICSPDATVMWRRVRFLILLKIVFVFYSLCISPLSFCTIPIYVFLLISPTGVSHTQLAELHCGGLWI